MTCGMDSAYTVEELQNCGSRREKKRTETKKEKLAIPFKPNKQRAQQIPFGKKERFGGC